jgi:predicted Zn-ribbon and HTH transcriptional regulator
LEVADIFRDHGPAWRKANAGHVSLDQLKVMSAIESCRTAALGGHVARCEDCAYTSIAYNSCRNRHCPKCQASAARPYLPLSAVSSLGGFRTPAAELAVPSLMRPASETLHKPGRIQGEQISSEMRSISDIECFA